MQITTCDIAQKILLPADAEPRRPALITLRFVPSGTGLYMDRRTAALGWTTILHLQATEARTVARAILTTVGDCRL